MLHTYVRVFCSGYFVSLCCSVYCLCETVYCTVLLPPGVNQIAVNKYIVSYHIISSDSTRTVSHQDYYSRTLADYLKTNVCSASSSLTGTRTASGFVSTDGTDRHAPLRPPKRSNAREMLWSCARNAQNRQTVYHRQNRSNVHFEAARTNQSQPQHYLRAVLSSRSVRNFECVT